MSLLSKYEFIEKTADSSEHHDFISNKVMTAGCPINKILPFEKQQLLFQNLGIPAGLVHYDTQRKWDVYSFSPRGGESLHVGGESLHDVIDESHFNNLFYMISNEHDEHASNNRSSNKTRKKGR